ncbi:hypothetical protein BV911_06700 [Pseudoruegeria sp. SK021]|nr:hypothetical protein BV911_06700 [Pseudoruegeria sp. SK021]
MSLTALLLQGCSGNSGGWFSEPVATSLEPKDGYAPETVDTRPLIDDITALRVEPTVGGLILWATGLPPTQGYWDATLVKVGDADTSATALTYEFRIRPPVSPQLTSSPDSREIQAGVFVSDIALRDIRTLTVIGARNSRSVNR